MSFNYNLKYKPPPPPDNKQSKNVKKNQYQSNPIHYPINNQYQKQPINNQYQIPQYSHQIPQHPHQIPEYSQNNQYQTPQYPHQIPEYSQNNPNVPLYQYNPYQQPYYYPQNFYPPSIEAHHAAYGQTTSTHVKPNQKYQKHSKNQNSSNKKQNTKIVKEGPDGVFMGNPLIKLESPEDIEKWIQERKTKFPNKQNIEKKLEEKNLKRNLDQDNLNTKKIKLDSDQKNPKVCKFYLKGKCKKGLVCPFFHPPKQTPNGNLEAQNSLFRKLIQTDINRDRSFILQSIRFIMENHFLQQV
ncbi:hypothetical protein BC833DRAFT_576697 [Globomyces pollinis-pini]|nr:hypothetical protein BC833DRAFT_576697 [Globomyces pollinis-pini]